MSTWNAAIGAACDAWKTGNYGDDCDGDLLCCDRCGELYLRDDVTAYFYGPDRGLYVPGGYIGCTCECEITGEYVRYCDCAKCAERRAEMEG